MTRRMILPLLFGLVGAAILISLGVWQLQRLAWKEAVLADIGARILAAPVAIPATPNSTDDRYLPVTVQGRFTGPEIDVLTSRKQIGAGFRIIAAFQTVDGRNVMVDRGFLGEDTRATSRAVTEATVTGNLHWPDETDSFTPAPDARLQMWFARDVTAMAAALETEPVLIVARFDTGDGIEPMPVDTAGIPNDHLNYALTWFSLAVVWLGMTGLLLWRIRQRPS